MGVWLACVGVCVAFVCWLGPCLLIEVETVDPENPTCNYKIIIISHSIKFISFQKVKGNYCHTNSIIHIIHIYILDHPDYFTVRSNKTFFTLMVKPGVRMKSTSHD